jgi:hypothetical protein
MNHNIDRQTAVTVIKEVEAAVAAVFAAHGLTKPKVRGSFGDSLKITLEASPDRTNDNGINIATPEALAYTRYHASYDLPANGLGIKFLSQGKEFVVTGLSPNRPKFPINAVCTTDGKAYKFGRNVIPKINAAAQATV